MSPRPIEVPIEGLTDGVVRLRLGSEADVERITAFVQDPEVVRWTTIPPNQDAELTRHWMQRGTAGLAMGSDLALVIADATTDEAVGTIGLHDINRAAERAVAGYVLALEARAPRSREHRLARDRRVGWLSRGGVSSLIHAHRGRASRHADVRALAGRSKALKIEGGPLGSEG